MGHLIKKNNLSVGDILSTVNTEKTYFIYTQRSIRIIKSVAFVLLALFIGNFISKEKQEPIRLQPVASVQGTQIFGTPVKDVNIIDVTAVAPFMKNKQEEELKIKGQVSKVEANGGFEMKLADGQILKVTTKNKSGISADLLMKEVVMNGKVIKNVDSKALSYEANSLMVL